MKVTARIAQASAVIKVIAYELEEKKTRNQEKRFYRKKCYLSNGYHLPFEEWTFEFALEIIGDFD